MADPIFAPLSGASDITGALGDLFGTSSSTNVSGSTTASASATATTDQKSVETFKVDKAAIDKIIQDILSSDQGLAAIFSEEQAGGIYDSTVAQKATADLMAKIAGEIAKLTGTREVSQTGTQQQSQQSQTDTRQTTESESDGLLGQIFG